MSFNYEYARPALTIDCVVFGLAQGELKLLLIQRGQSPFKGDWALPGGFVEMDETLDEAAKRELQEETGVKIAYLEQLYTFGAINRDPRERVVSVAYYALVKALSHTPKAASDAQEAAWFSVAETPKLAFDHDAILRMARERLQNKVRYQPVGFDLLPPKFTLRELQQLYETILDQPLDKRNFRKKLNALGVLIELDEYETDVPHRAAKLYRFDKVAYQRRVKQGFPFEI